MNLATDATAQEFRDAYKAAQPPAVQALLNLHPNISGPNADRTQMGADLAREGYLIDVPIMVWNWDRYEFTKFRGSMGYTWVPSASQPPVLVAPSIKNTGSALQLYDPQMVPAGAILVTLDMDLLPLIFAPMPGSAAALALEAKK